MKASPLLRLAVVFFVVSCGGGGGDGPTAPPPAPPAPPPPTPTPVTMSVVINAGLDTLIVQDTVARTATATLSNGQSSAGATFIWSTSNQAVATVSGTGQVIARSAGSFALTVTATLNNMSATAAKTILVENDVITSLSISAPDTVGQANGFLLTAKALGRRGRELPATFTYASSNTGVLAIASDGFVLAGSPGTATLTVSSSGISATKSVRVGAAPVPIKIVFLTPPTTTQKQIAYASAARWQRLFTGPLTGNTVSVPAGSCDPGSPAGTYAPADGITLMMSFGSDIGGGVGNARSCIFREGTGSGQLTTVVGIVRIDIPYFDLRPDARMNVMGHEIGHALGVGAYDVMFSALVTGFADSPDPRYVGAEGFRQYKLAGGTATSGIPLCPQTIGCSGHYRGDQVFREIMSFGGETVSAISIGYLIDLGYKMDVTRGEPYTVTFPQGAVPVTNNRSPVAYDDIRP